MEELYMDIAMNLLCDMRLRIEGAVDLYEQDGTPLRNLAVKNNMPASAAAFDAIGSALYHLRQDIRNLHEAHTQESIRQANLL